MGVSNEVSTQIDMLTSSLGVYVVNDGGRGNDKIALHDVPRPSADNKHYGM